MQTSGASITSRAPTVIRLRVNDAGLSAVRLPKFRGRKGGRKKEKHWKRFSSGEQKAEDFGGPRRFDTSVNFEMNTFGESLKFCEAKE